MAFTNMPPRMSVAKDPEVLKRIHVLNVTIPLMEGPNAITALSMPVFEQYMQELAKAEQLVRNGRMGARQALEEVSARVQQELDRFMRRR